MEETKKSDPKAQTGEETQPPKAKSQKRKGPGKDFPEQKRRKKEAEERGDFTATVEPEAHWEVTTEDPKSKAEREEEKKKAEARRAQLSPAENLGLDILQAVSGGAKRVRNSAKSTINNTLKKTALHTLLPVRPSLRSLFKKNRKFKTKTEAFHGTDKCPTCEIKYEYLPRFCITNAKHRIEKDLRIRYHLAKHVIESFDG